MKTNFKAGDYICPKTAPTKTYKIISITSLAPNQTEQDIIDASTENGEREKFQVSEVQLSNIDNIEENIFLDL